MPARPAPVRPPADRARAGAGAARWWAPVAALLLAFAGSIGPAFAAARTVCSVTVNSPDEQAALRRHLGEGEFRFVELVEPGRRDWLASACRAGLRCDVLVISGHFDGHNEFFSDDPLRREYLTVDELERVSCSGSCPGLFERLREVYLFGCNTLNPQPLGSASAEVMRNLVRDGASRHEADQLMSSPGARLGESSRDRMRQVFPGVPVIYGFAGFAPVGPVAAQTLELYLQAGGTREVGQGRRSARLLGQFAGFGLTAVAGVTERDALAGARRDMCQFADDRRNDLQRLTFLHRLLQRPVAEVMLHLDRIERALDRIDPRLRRQADVARRLEAIAQDLGARSRVFALARDAGPGSARVRLLDLGQRLGWLSEEHRWLELARMLGELQQRAQLGPGDVDLACTLNRGGDLDGAYARRVAAGGPTDSVAHAALRACLGSSEARALTLAGLASPQEADVRAARAYLRHHPIEDPQELHRVTDAIAAMAPSPAQAQAVESLGRLYLSDREVLQRLLRLYAQTPSPAVQAAVAGSLLRADPRVMPAEHSAERVRLLELLRQQRRPNGAAGGMIDALIHKLESS